MAEKDPRKFFGMMDVWTDPENFRASLMNKLGVELARFKTATTSLEPSNPPSILVASNLEEALRHSHHNQDERALDLIDFDRTISDTGKDLCFTKEEIAGRELRTASEAFKFGLLSLMGTRFFRRYFPGKGSLFDDLKPEWVRVVSARPDLFPSTIIVKQYLKEHKLPYFGAVGSTHDISSVDLHLPRTGQPTKVNAYLDVVHPYTAGGHFENVAIGLGGLAGLGVNQLVNSGVPRRNIQTRMYAINPALPFLGQGNLVEFEHEAQRFVPPQEV